MYCENNATKTQLEKPEAQVQLTSEKLKNQDSLTGVARGPRNPSGKYSDSHQRLLKRKRMRSCELSLAWLQREGYTPTRVELKCNKTGNILKRNVRHLRLPWISQHRMTWT